MRTCPQCGSQYSDDTLSFCLQDGTPLTSGAVTNTPTAVLSEEEATRVRSSTSGPGAWRPSEVTRVQTLEPTPSSSKSGVGLALAAIGAVVVLGLGGIIALLIWQNSGRPIVSNVPSNSNIGSNGSVPTTTPAVTSNSTNTNSSIATSTPASNSTTATNTGTSGSDTSQSKSDVSQRIYDHCKSSVESDDLSRHMNDYASTVDYYNKSGASVAFVRADKARAFSKFPSKSVNISNMSVSVDSSGETATATFDKEWTFSGDSTNSGKVRSELRFRLIGGRWLITGERDVKVYYTR